MAENEPGPDSLGEDARLTSLDQRLNAAQAAEHYEIVRYGSLIAWAKQLGRSECAGLLQKTLEEEKAADKKLNTYFTSVGALSQSAGMFFPGCRHAGHSTTSSPFWVPSALSGWCPRPCRLRITRCRHSRMACDTCL